MELSVLTVLFSIFSLARLVVTQQDNSEHEVSTTCPVQTMDLSFGNTEMSALVVFVEHVYSSVTNGQPYGKKTRIGKFILNNAKHSASQKIRVSRSNTQTLTFAYNGTHVCAAAEYLLEYEPLYRGKNVTNACDSICFLAHNYGTRHTIRLFRSETSDIEIGTWSMSDYATLYTSIGNNLNCYYGNESFPWLDDERSRRNLKLNSTKCPVGEQCRVTIAQKSFSSTRLIYVGCELDSTQFNGCTGKCDYLKKQRSPSGSYDTWVHMCKYCCKTEFCNFPSKCDKYSCNFSTNQFRNASTSVRHSSLQSLLIVYVIMMYSML